MRTNEDHEHTDWPCLECDVYQPGPGYCAHGIRLGSPYCGPCHLDAERTLAFIAASRGDYEPM